MWSSCFVSALLDPQSIKQKCHLHLWWLDYLLAVPPFPSCDHVPSAEAQAARRMGHLTSRPVPRAAYAFVLSTRSQEGIGGTARSLFADNMSTIYTIYEPQQNCPTCV